MNNFLVAQSDDPFNPAPVLILADHMEERGDSAGATVLRGLVAAGIDSLVAMSTLETVLVTCSQSVDEERNLDPDRGVVCGYGHGDVSVSGMGNGHGFGDDIVDGHEYRSGYGHGSTDGFWYGEENHYECGIGKGLGDGLGNEGNGHADLRCDG